MCFGCIGTSLRVRTPQIDIHLCMCLRFSRKMIHSVFLTVQLGCCRIHGKCNIAAHLISGFLHGTLTCALSAQDDGQSTLSRLENRITTLAPVREEPILSPAQALAALQSGKSFEGAWFAQSVQQIEVRSCTLDYLSDSKGFYQPVYRFELSLAGQAGGITDAVDYVPALF